MCKENERVVSLEGGSFSVKGLDDDTRHGVEAICDVSREEVLRNLLGELKLIVRERMAEKFSSKEIEGFEDELARIVARMMDGIADSVSFPDLRDLSRQFVERDIAHLRRCVERGGLPDIQGAFIRALHPESEGDGVDEDSPEVYGENLERMEGDSPGFARMIQRLEEDIFPEGKD